MIRINLVDGTAVTTSRHSLEQVQAAKNTGVGIVVGGDLELSYVDAAEGVVDVPAERTIQAAEIASVEVVV